MKMKTMRHREDGGIEIEPPHVISNTRPFKEVFERERRRFENALGDFLMRSWDEYDPTKVFAPRNKARPQDVHEVLVRTIQGLLVSRILCHVGGICADPSPDWKLSVLRRAFPRIFRTPEVKALKARYAKKMEWAMKKKHRRWQELFQTKRKKESQGVRETPRRKRLRRNKARYLQSRDKQESHDAIAPWEPASTTATATRWHARHDLIG